MSNSLADTKIEVLTLKEELIKEKEQNLKLKSEIKELTDNKTIMSLVGDVYQKNGEGQYCTTCWDNSRKTIRIKEETPDFQIISGHKYVCPSCKTPHKGK